MKSTLAIIAIGFASFSLHAQTTVNWIGGPSGNWNDGSNWDTGSPPYSDQNVLIIGQPFTITVPSGYLAIGSEVALHSNSTLLLEGDASFIALDLPGDLSVDAGSTLSFGGGFVANIINHGLIESKPSTPFIGLTLFDLNNYGDIAFEDGAANIIGIKNNGVINNRPGGSIIISEAFIGIEMDFNNTEFYNYVGGIVNVEVEEIGINNGVNGAPLFENYGVISLDGGDYGSSSISNRGSFINKVGSNLYVNSSYNAILNSANFVNETGAEIIFNIANPTGFRNFPINGSEPTLTNAGIIIIDNYSSSGQDGKCFSLENADFTNTASGTLRIIDGSGRGFYCDASSTTSNAGLIEIQEGSFNEYSFALGGTFNNSPCGTVILHSPEIEIFGTQIFNNHGWLVLTSYLSYGFDATLINEGVIGDLYSSLYTFGIQNNRIIVEQSNGPACENQPFANALTVENLAGFTVVGWYTDPSCTISAGTYNATNNTYTPNSNAIGLDEFYVKINDNGGGCEYVFVKRIYGGVLDEVVYYEDLDDDDFGNSSTATPSCTPIAGFSTMGGDCDDNDPLEFPGQVWYEDGDGDGYAHGAPMAQCERPGGDWYAEEELIATSGDCDDSDPLEFPGQTWYKDEDEDGYSDGTSLVTCNRPPDYYIASELTATSGDCNDINPNEYPGQVWYKDVDGDEYSDGTSLNQCEDPGADWYFDDQLIATSGDCDDYDPLEFPGQSWFLDNDLDEWSNGTVITQCQRPSGNYFAAGELNGTSGDCDDSDPDIHPGAIDSCDDIDNNCNGFIDDSPCGNTCAIAKPIFALPFTFSSTTLYSGDDYDDDDACFHTWMTGEDYVLEYTPPVSQVARIKLTNTGNPTSGIYAHAVFVLDICPNQGGFCFYSAWHPTNGNNDPIYIETVELQGGTTYFIVVDCHATFHENYSFTLEIDLPQGNICSNAIPLAPNSTASGSTYLLGNDYGWQDACNSDWMTGNDVVYTYTASAGEVARIQLEHTGPAPASGTYAHAVFVLDGCPDDAGATCMYTAFANSSTNLPVWIETILFPTAGTYYIVVASHGTFVPWYDYTLTIDNPLGNICENAVPIASLPYSATNQSTCLFGNDYSWDDACSTSWLTGNDFVYELTANLTGTIDIALSNLSDEYASILFLDGCPDDPGANCAFAGNSGSGNFTLEDQPVTMGNTYFVVISSFATFTDCHDYDIGITATPLPVELVRFSVEKLGESMALLRWETASEVDFSHYEIERSADGQLWHRIASQAAEGGYAAAAYQYEDDLATLMKTSPKYQFYYRLKMVDLNGSFEYSPTRTVRFDEDSGYEVFPNPTTGQWSLRNPKGVSGSAEVSMLDATGRVVFAQVIDFQEQTNTIFEGNTAWHLPGLYLLQVKQSGRPVWQTRLVVMSD